MAWPARQSGHRITINDSLVGMGARDILVPLPEEWRPSNLGPENRYRRLVMDDLAGHYGGFLEAHVTQLVFYPFEYNDRNLGANVLNYRNPANPAKMGRVSCTVCFSRSFVHSFIHSFIIYHHLSFIKSYSLIIINHQS